MKKRARLLALLLVVVMVTALFAACGNDNEPSNTTVATDGTTTADTSGDATDPSSTPADTTPGETSDIDVAGYNFTIVGNGDVFPQENEDGSYSSQTEEQLADELAALEERLGITLEQVEYTSDNRLEQVTTAALGGLKIGDLLWLRQRDFFPAAKANALLPLDDPQLVDAGLNYQDETRWYQPVMEWTQLFDHPWGLVVASEYIAAQTGYFVTFNKELCSSAGYDDMYQLVRDMEWTWDVYREIARETTRDTDGDGTPDIWGTGATAWGNEAVTNGVQFIGEVDGKWQMTIDSEAGVEALQFLYDLNYGDGTRWDADSGECREGFANGMVTFNWANMGHINGSSEVVFNSEHDYGIIPMPKGPNATEYASMTDNNNAFVIQAANEDLDKAVAIMNEWALIVNDTESYLDILNDGRCRTEDDMEMMVDYIIPNYTLNMGKMTQDIWYIVDYNQVDAGIIATISYLGWTPQQAIEAHREMLNNALDAFFDQ